MKPGTRRTRRIICLLLAVALVLSVFAGLALTIFAENYTYNWGVRDTVCTALSDAAQAYYTGEYTYNKLALLNGEGTIEVGNSLTASQNNPLFNKLYTLMSETDGNRNLATNSAYDNLSTLFRYSDCENGDTSGKMRDFWCTDMYIAWNGTYLNREHVWQKSQASFQEKNGGADLHHLRPANAYINQTSHNDKPYGVVSPHDSSTEQYGNVVSGSRPFGGWADSNIYEPPDNAKGDTARIFLFVYVRWKQPNLYTDVSSGSLPAMDSDDNLNTGKKIIESLDTLLAWCAMDPVDTWEMGRNDAIESIQGNRNVFIDYPEYAWYLFGKQEQMPTSMTTPSGEAANGPIHSYSISAVSSDTEHGTVSIEGDVITAYPADGYYAAGFLVTEGEATVEQSGNTFTVTARSDCTVMIVFAPVQSYTVTYLADNTSVGSATATAGSTIKLPATALETEGWTFVGWTDHEFSDTTEQPTYYAPGADYAVLADTTLYAVYVKTDGGSTSGVTLTKLNTTDTIHDGDNIVIVAQNTTYGLYQQTQNTSYVANYTFLNNADEIAKDTKKYITFTKNGNNWYLGDATNGYLYSSGSNNLALDMTNKSEFILGSNTMGFTLTTGGRYLSCRTDLTSSYANLWRLGGTNAATGSSTLDLYRLSVGTPGISTYSIHPSGTAHVHELTHTAAVAASCGTDGNVEYWHCDGCGKYFADAAAANEISLADTVISATGAHVWSDYTYDAAGHSQTCTVCGEVKNEAHTLTETILQEASYTETGLKQISCPICGYSDTVTIPMLSYESDGAVYHLSSELRNGDRVVIYNPANAKALTSELTSNYYLAGTDVTVADGELRTDNEAAIWTVAVNDDGSYTFTQDEKTLYGYRSGSYLDLAVSYADGYVDKWQAAQQNADTETFTIQCSGLTNQYGNEAYLEYYNGRFALYGTDKANSDPFLMQFYVLAPELPTVRGVSLTLNGTINANAYITIPDALVEAGLWAELDGSAAKIELSDKLSSGAYRFTVERAAKNMNTQTAIRLLDETGSPIRLVNESGTEYEADTFRFCVEDYLQTVIRNAERFDEKLVALCKAMSDYGHYAQIALKFENEPGKIWPEVYHTAEDFAAVHPTDASSTEVQGTGVSYYGASVILRSETRIRAYFRIEGDAAGATATVDGSPAELHQYGSGSYYYVDVADIHAKALGQIHTIRVQLGDDSATLSNYSAYSYAARVLDRAAAGQTDEKLENVVRALWRYGQAAEAYFPD